MLNAAWVGNATAKAHADEDLCVTVLPNHTSISGAVDASLVMRHGAFLKPHLLRKETDECVVGARR